MSNPIKKKIIYFCFSIILIIFSQLFLKELPVQIPNISRVLFSSLALMLFWCFARFNVQNIYERIGILIILVFGISSAVLKPVQVGLDEEAHFTSTLKVSVSGIFQYQKYNLDDYDRVFKHDFFRNKEVFSKSGNFKDEKHGENSKSGKIISFNNPAYIPSAIGWKIGELISNKIYISYFLGRIFNVIAYALLILLAYRICRKNHEVLFVFTSFPSYLYFVSGYHYDSIYFGLSAIMFSLICKYFSEKKKISNKEIASYIISSFIFTFVKFPFVLLGVLTFFIPNDKFQSRKQKNCTRLFSSLQLFVSLLYYLNFNTNKQNLDVEIPTIGYFIKHPLPIVRTLLDIPDVFEFNIRYTQIFAKSYSATSMMMSEILLIVLMIVVTYRLKISITNKFKTIFFVFSVVISLAIVYAITTDPRVYKMGMTYVPGVQGRYFYLFGFFIPFYIDNFVYKIFGNSTSSEVNIAEKLEYTKKFILSSLIFLNILNLGITLYTMVPY